MLGRRRNQKAGDIFRKSQLVIVTQATFADAFPSVERADIDVTEVGHGTSVARRFVETNAREFVDCTNPACFGGGVSVGAVLREMVVAQSTDATQTHLCRGYEGSRRRRVGDCPHVFRVNVRIEYRETRRGDAVELPGSRQASWPPPSRAALAYLATRSC